MEIRILATYVALIALAIHHAFSVTANGNFKANEMWGKAIRRVQNINRLRPPSTSAELEHEVGSGTVRFLGNKDGSVVSHGDKGTGTAVIHESENSGTGTVVTNKQAVETGSKSDSALEDYLQRLENGEISLEGSFSPTVHEDGFFMLNQQPKALLHNGKTFTLQKPLGFGSYAGASLYSDGSDFFVLKSTYWPEKDVKLQKDLNHDPVVEAAYTKRAGLLKSKVMQEGSKFHYAVTYAQGKPVKSLLNAMNESPEQWIKLVENMDKAIDEQLIQHRMVHNDLHMGNLIADENGNILVIDHGRALEMTPVKDAPDILIGQGLDKQRIYYDFKQLLSELKTKKTFFKSDEKLAEFENLVMKRLAEESKKMLVPFEKPPGMEKSLAELTLQDLETKQAQLRETLEPNLAQDKSTMSPELASSLKEDLKRDMELTAQIHSIKIMLNRYDHGVLAYNDYHQKLQSLLKTNDGEKDKNFKTRVFELAESLRTSLRDRRKQLQEVKSILHNEATSQNKEKSQNKMDLEENFKLGHLKEPVQGKRDNPRYDINAKQILELEEKLGLRENDDESTITSSVGGSLSSNPSPPGSVKKSAMTSQDKSPEVPVDNVDSQSSNPESTVTSSVGRQSLKAENQATPLSKVLELEPSPRQESKKTSSIGGQSFPKKKQDIPDPASQMNGGNKANQLRDQEQNKALVLDPLSLNPSNVASLGDDMDSILAPSNTRLKWVLISSTALSLGAIAMSAAAAGVNSNKQK